ncbi:F-box/LRR-repeat protein 3-like isoform X1 [Rutidosis leptorrhynchoides]|uniref:F-box/LRR-repeat protein 3-like isoform X1 n=1 Tax=Rutidosis leptorrhynchoides TaxID=125765 RepID=UPI003A98E690
MESSCLIISILTDDLLLRVLDGLHDDSDRKNFRITCKCFHKIESVHRTRIKFFRPEFIPDLLRNYTQADTLDFSGCPRIFDGTIAVLLSNVNCFGWTGRVRKLVLSRTTSLKFSGLELLIRSCPKLQSVDLSHCCQFGDREAAAISFAADLREVKLDKCLRLTDVGLAKIAIRCEKLEKISLKWCLEITDLGIDLLSNKCAHLKHLSVSYLKISNESLRSISSMKKLEVLSMAGCGLVGDEGLHFIGNGCPSLQTLDVSRCEHVSSTGLISVTRGCKSLQKLNAGYYFLEISTTVSHNLKDLKQLKTVRVDGARVNDYFFQMISTNCLLLVEVGLSKCEGVNDSGIVQLAYNLPNLKILDLTCCDDLTDMAISAIVRSCTKLLCLKLESCSLLTEKSFSYLGSSCRLLEELDLTECSVNDRGLENLSNCMKLRCLRLGICTDISNKGLSYIGSNCKNLIELDLYRCLNIGDDGLGFIATGCKKIRKLNLCYCPKITDKGMAYLSHLEELSDLEMRSLSEVTSVGMTAVASGCRKLSELDMKNCGNISDAGFWSLAYYSWNLQQINLSYCAVSDVGLCMMMGNLTRLQDVKLVNLANVSVRGYEVGLRACCARLKKVKLVATLRPLLSVEILETLGASGCRIRWD